MSDIWTAVDNYVNDLVVRPDEALSRAHDATVAAGMPLIAVSAAQGKFLQLLVRMSGAKTVLELGTLGGYSTIWMARGLPPDGKLVSLELEERHAEVARANLAEAGLSERAEVRIGPALESLPRLAAEDADFDFVFIDADKANIPAYMDWALKLTHPGGVIVVDNVVRQGKLADASSTDANVVGVRRLHDMLATDLADRVTATTIQTVGSKGYDGLTIGIVEG